MLTVDCQALLLVVLVGSWLSAVGCWDLGVDCHLRLSLTFSTVGDKLYALPMYLVCIQPLTSKG